VCEIANKKNYKDYVYVCPICFSKIHDCTCLLLPDSLIQIEKNILPSIKNLNSKGYFTDSCCEGHADVSNSKIFIIFRRNYRIIKKPPKGFECKCGVICADITGKSLEAKKRKKRILLNNLYEWTCNIE
jgi:hypothetical protein